MDLEETMAKITGRRRKFCALVAILCLSMAGCYWRRNIMAGNYDCSSLTDLGIFDGKSEKARVEEFAHYSVEKQYAVIICANEYIHAPASELLEAFGTS